MEKITFVTDDGGKEEFYVEEQTRINGVNYILVSDSKDDEANAYILKDISTDTDAEAEYVMVEDDTEFDAPAQHRYTGWQRHPATAYGYQTARGWECPMQCKFL